jgi:urease alpha subunit
MQTKTNQYKPRPHYSIPISLQVLKTRMYSSIKRRSEEKSVPYLSKEEFENFINKNSIILENLYKNWKENKFLQKLSPSIDRINPKQEYTPSNIQFLTNAENTIKGNKERTRLKIREIA